MKKRSICLLLLLALLVCGCVSGGETPSDAPASSSTPDDTSFTVSAEPSVPSDDASSVQPDPIPLPEQTDFFTANGQGILPASADLPAFRVPTDIPYLYSLPFELPEAVGTFGDFCRMGETYQLHYTVWEDGEEISRLRLYDVSTGALLAEKTLPDGCFSGPLPDGGFWYAEPEGISLTVCDRDGKGTVLRQASENYTGKNAPRLLALSPDGNTLLAGFGAENLFLLFDLRTGARTRVSAGVRAQSWKLLSSGEDSFLLAGSRGALVQLSIGEASANLLLEGDPMCEASGGLLRLDGVRRGLLLRGQTADADGNWLFAADFLWDDESVAAFGFGCCATVSWDNYVRFYDLRAETCVAEFAFDSGGTPEVTLTEDGIALLCDGVRCCLYDLPAAHAASTDGEPLQAVYTTSKTAGEFLARAAEAIGETYGVTLHVGSEGNDFDIPGYIGQAEFDPLGIYHALRVIDEILSRYPDGMLREAYEGLFDGGLHLYLCSGLYGYLSDGLSTASGVTTANGEDILMALDIYNGLETTIPHELSHVFDYRIEVVSAESDTDWLLLWENLHPFRNAYIYSYSDYERNMAYTYAGESSQSRVWFVDDYSRTFPTEDRARIMENLFNPLDGKLPVAMQSPHLLEKARFYSYILRQCFSSCGESAQPLYWETYLGPIDESVAAPYLSAA